MSWRSIAVYYAAAAILGGYLWIAHQGREAVEAGGDGDSVVVPIVEDLASRVDRLVIDGRGVQAILVRGEDARWSVARPAGVSVTSDLVAALLDTLTTIPPIEILGGQSENLGAFGLAPAAISVELGSAGEVIAKLDLGKRNPTRTAVYAVRRGTAGVYLLGLNARYYLELVLDELTRERTGGGG